MINHFVTAPFFESFILYRVTYEINVQRSFILPPQAGWQRNWSHSSELDS